MQLRSLINLFALVSGGDANITATKTAPNAAARKARIEVQLLAKRLIVQLI